MGLPARFLGGEGNKEAVITSSLKMSSTVYWANGSCGRYRLTLVCPVGLSGAFFSRVV